MLSADNFSYQETDIPEPGENQMLIRTLYMSLDPAMRAWMNDVESYIEPVAIGDVMRALTVGRVEKSNNPDFEVGDNILCMNGWQDYALSEPGGIANKLPEGVPLPLTNFLSVLGITGLTAYFGLLDITDPKEGECVVVSTAAGAVGSIVGQIAKIKGCRAVGITGSDDKCAWITDELGFDAAINYKTKNVAEELRAACPNGVDIYFDNVGGEILNDVLGQINPNARVSICGAISQYNATEVPPGPSNYLTLLTKRARMEGFIVMDFMDRFPEAIMQMAQWIMEGKIKHREDIIDGLENAPEAVLTLFNGTNKGKLIVNVAGE